ncbi:MAG TPA: MerR family transcriptional regulator [Puia sp.]|jgi:DNA-binding transcriptional MerR regulator|nr:MerR family transcriptional regulator [Puia sp.]
MSSKQTQIALDFGPEPQSQPVPPPAANGAEEDAARPYLAAGGVGIRVKSFKQPAPPPAPAPPEPNPVIDPRPAVKVTNGDLFGVAGTIDPDIEAPAASTTPAPIEAPAIEAPAVAENLVVAETPAIAAAQTSTPPIATPTVADPSVETETPAPAESPADAEPLPRRRTSPGKSALPKGPSKRGRKSLKQVAAEADLIEIPTDEVLFSKQYYTMGEVSEMFRVNQSLLRFWETEFDILQPKKNKKGDRYFRPVDIKNLHLIYHLLRQKKYTIEGAKDFLKKNRKAEDRFEVIQRLQQIKAFLVEWRAQL